MTYLGDDSTVLPRGTELLWYTLTEVLGRGGFGITYQAQDNNLGRVVAIKEYAPIGIAVRGDGAVLQPGTAAAMQSFQYGLRNFLAEARTLAKFRHPNIVRVHAVFEAQGTAYMVMDYEPGATLQSILGRAKRLDFARAVAIKNDLLSALATVHAEGLIHRDVKPLNIVIRPNGDAVLLDFGSARQSFLATTAPLTSLVSPGFAPFEQYSTDSAAQGPWTDIYAVSATLYRAITGVNPLPSLDRSRALIEAGKDNFVPSAEIVDHDYELPFLHAVDHGLALRPTDRPQTIAEWATEFETAEKWLAAPSESTTIHADARRTRSTVPPIDQDRITKPIAHERRGRFLARVNLQWAISAIPLAVIAGYIATKEPAKESIFNEVSKRRVSELLLQAAEDSADLRLLNTDFNFSTVTEGEAQSLGPNRDPYRLKRYVTPNGAGAVEKFQKVLQVQPTNREALKGIEWVAKYFIDQGTTAAETGDLDAAQTYLNLSHQIKLIPESKALETRLEGLRAKAAAISANGPAGAHFETFMDKLADGTPGPEMVVLPKASFLMGRSPGDEEYFVTEDPAHQVTFDYAFAVSRTEITFDLWDRCAAEGACEAAFPSDAGWGRANRPVINVSWNDANRFINWLNSQTGGGYRLPTESEWEFAARGGTRTVRFWGSDRDNACLYANVFDSSGSAIHKEWKWPPHNCDDHFAGTAPVASYKANAYGIYDSLGNVWEWVQDCFHDTYVDAPANGAAWEERECARRVIRGGSWTNSAEDVRSAVRDGVPANAATEAIGFRVVKTIRNKR